MEISRKSIVAYLDRYLNTDSIEDSSRNGLQVQGGERVSRIGLAVDACLAVYRKAVTEGCEMVIGHHGIIWDGIRSITGPVHHQVKYLLDHDLNLYASHLPLDLHPVVGNNIQLARMLGLKKTRPFGEYHGTLIGYAGSLPKPQSLAALAETLHRQLHGDITSLAFGPKRVRTVGIVSGGGAGELGEAIGKGLDCYLTGEPAHHNHHAALEGGINVLYAGHYHTETPGVKALGRLLERKFRIETVFLDVPTAI